MKNETVGIMGELCSKHLRSCCNIDSFFFFFHFKDHKARLWSWSLKLMKSLKLLCSITWFSNFDYILFTLKETIWLKLTFITEYIASSIFLAIL